MSKPAKPSPVKLFVGAIFASEGVLMKAKDKLKQNFGPIDFQSTVMPFDYTKYYEEEMGAGLSRQFFSFQRLINPQQLPKIKLHTNRLEKFLSSGAPRLARGAESRYHWYRDKKADHQRTINLDPGYITPAKLVLATCKNYSHRIYLDKGIYAEITLNFQDGTFLPCPWAYPDYKSQDYIQNFNMIRQLYLKQLLR